MRRMKLLGSDVKITGSDTLHDDAEAHGRWQFRYSLIELDSKLEASAQGEVLIHEVIEGICQKLEIDLPHNAITSLGSALHSWARENPALVRDVVAGRAIVKRARR